LKLKTIFLDGKLENLIARKHNSKEDRKGENTIALSVG
jgi:hypothetical protein